jgi:diguanylate cyclase (GGDEF)-like protein
VGNSVQKVLQRRGDKKGQSFSVRNAPLFILLFVTYLTLLLELPSKRISLWFVIWAITIPLYLFYRLRRNEKQYSLEFLFSLVLLIAGVTQASGIPWLKLFYFPFFLLLTFWHRWRVVLPLACLVPFMELHLFFRRGIEIQEAAFFASLIFTTGIALILHHKKPEKKYAYETNISGRESTMAGESGAGIFSGETVVTQYLESMFRPDEEIKEVLEITKSTLVADSVHLFVPADGGLRLRSTTEEDGSIIPSNTGIVPVSFEEKKSALFLDILEKKRDVGYLKKEKIASLITVPVLDGNFSFGVLAIDSGRFQAFNSADLETLQTYANQIMRILQRERVYRQIQRSFSHLQVLNEESAQLLSSLKSDVIARNLIDGAYRIAPCAGMFCLSRGREFEVVSQQGLPEQEKKLFSVKDTLLDMAVKNREVVYISDARSYRSPVPFKTGTIGSVLVLPMLYGKDVLGVLTLVAETTNAFSSSQIEFIKLLTNQASSSLANAKFHEEIEHLAVTDGLTGLFNHRHFQEKLSGEFNRLGRFAEPLSLLLIDIDFFKKINDTYGHPAGDMVLKKVSGIIKKTIRNIDIAARYGGEEFAVILPGTNSQGAMNMAERLRKVIMDTVFSAEGEKFTVTVSVGISTSAQGVTEAKNKEELIERADKALYEAKRTGRNRSVVWTALDTSAG